MTQANPFPISASDLVDVDDLDLLANQTTSEAQNLFQDCYHWLLTLPGTNLDNQARGVGVETYLNGSADQMAALPTAIEADFAKDPRIKDVSASVTPPGNPYDPTQSWQIQINVSGAAGVFAMLFSYNQAQGLQVLNPYGS